MRLLLNIFLIGSTLSTGFSAMSAVAGDGDFYLPESKLTISNQVIWLAIDDQSLQKRKHLTLTLNKPEIRHSPVLTPELGNLSTPDSMASHFYGTVLHDQGKFRMWYYAVSLRAKPADFMQGPVCYAESDNGIDWNKPDLGQVEINGSTNNNAVKLSDEMTQCAAVIIDEDDPDPMRRYKMMYTVLTHTWVFRSATSGDGIHWTVPDRHPTDKFLEMGSFLKFGDSYIVHGQGIGIDAAGIAEGRQGYASRSTDFVEWEQDYRSAFRLPEPKEVNKRGLIGDYPQVHLGVGATSFGNVAVGLYGIWHNPPTDQRRKKGWYGAGLITCDLGLVVSNDGVTFREPLKDFVYLSGEESPVTPVPGVEDPTILCQANGILNVGEKTFIYHGRWRNATISGQDYYAEVALATLPRDRWGSLRLEADASYGTVLSAPITFPKKGCKIELNADDSADMIVELSDEQGHPLPEFSGQNHGAIQALSGSTSKVQWADKSLASLAGKTVRIRLGFTNSQAKLFAVTLNAVD